MISSSLLSLSIFRILCRLNPLDRLKRILKQDWSLLCHFEVGDCVRHRCCQIRLYLVDGQVVMYLAGHEIVSATHAALARLVIRVAHDAHPESASVVVERDKLCWSYASAQHKCTKLIKAVWIHVVHPLLIIFVVQCQIGTVIKISVFWILCLGHLRRCPERWCL